MGRPGRPWPPQFLPNRQRWYFLVVHEHVAKILHVCRLTVTCYLNRSEFVAFGHRLFRQCAHAFWYGKPHAHVCSLREWLHKKTPERMYCCAYYRAIAHAHTLIGRPGFPSMATGLHVQSTVLACKLILCFLATYITTILLTR